MKSGIIYLLTGTSHAARLIVSLASLRQFYQGPVVLYTTEYDSHEIGRRCAHDDRLSVTHCRTSRVAIRKNSAFVTKIALLLDPPFDTTAYLDCDTLVTGPIDDLLEVSERDQFIATRFAQWVTTGKTIRRRIERWKAVKSETFDVDSLVNSALETARPSINGGVCAARRGATILQPWFDLSMDGRRTFICDEVALHLLLHHHPHRILDSRYNNSPVYGDNDDVRIWHFHGGKHTKLGRGMRRWLPHYQAAVAQNLAGIAEWGTASDQSLASIADLAGRFVAPTE